MAISFGRLAQSSESCAVARRRAPLRNGCTQAPQSSELVPTGVRVLNLCSALPAASARAPACAISLSTRVFGTELPGGECCPCGGDHLCFRSVTKDRGQTAPRREKPCRQRVDWGRRLRCNNVQESFDHCDAASIHFGVRGGSLCTASRPEKGS